MKRLLAIGIFLSCYLSYGIAQGIRGNVKITGKAILITTGHVVTLNWNGSQGANSYCVYRGTSHGQYSKIACGITTTNYADVQIQHSQTLYYVTTAVSGSNESGYSNETVAVIP